MLATRAPDQIRMMTWNVGSNSVFAPGSGADAVAEGRPGQFARVLRAVRPDVLCLQQVTRGPKDVAAFVAAILPAGVGHAWQAHVVLDNAVVSRFPLKSQAGRIFRHGALRRGHAAALVDLPDPRYPRDFYLVCAHFQSEAGRAEASLRQRQADAIVAWIADATSAGGKITLPPGTPFALMGDFNVIDDPSPSLNTLLTGDIADEKTFGGDSRPDWDGSNLTDMLPHHNESGTETYTWRDDAQPYPPAALDRILYADSAIGVGRSFVLNTMRMTGDELHRAGLRATDVMRDPAKGIHDHLPIVADLIVLRAAVRPVQPPH